MLKKNKYFKNEINLGANNLKDYQKDLANEIKKLEMISYNMCRILWQL